MRLLWPLSCACPPCRLKRWEVWRNRLLTSVDYASIIVGASFLTFAALLAGRALAELAIVAKHFMP